MNPYVRDRINRKLDTLSDERLYQILDYVEFLESKYAEKSAPVANVFTRFAEGVEDTATLAQLTRYGCDVAQGWCIGRPLPVEEIDIGGINERMRRDLKMVA